MGIFPETVQEKSVKSKDSSEQKQVSQESPSPSRRRMGPKKNGSDKTLERRRCHKMERLAKRRQERAERHRALLSSKPKKEPDLKSCHRRYLPPGTKRPRSAEVCAARRRRYVRYAIRCCLRNRKPKFIPTWWHNADDRNLAIALAFE